jgi:hypothetical protein
VIEMPRKTVTAEWGGVTVVLVPGCQGEWPSLAGRTVYTAYEKTEQPIGVGEIARRVELALGVRLEELPYRVVRIENMRQQNTDWGSQHDPKPGWQIAMPAGESFLAGGRFERRTHSKLEWAAEAIARVICRRRHEVEEKKKAAERKAELLQQVEAMGGVDAVKTALNEADVAMKAAYQEAATRSGTYQRLREMLMAAGEDLFGAPSVRDARAERT